MSELRRDPITGRWNIINTDEPSGPKDFHLEPFTPSAAACPFCPGNERLTPAEIYALRPSVSAANGSDWSLRVIPNKFPALRIEGELGLRGLGLFDLSNGIGAHEVIIETPDHRRQMADLTLPELEQTLGVFRARSLDLRGDRRLKYTLIFKNFGRDAGASLEHSHSQLIALPIIPKRVMEELKGAARYAEFRGRCPYCDMLHQELEEDERLVAENKGFLAFCPFVSSFPFETWILPRAHHSDFAAITQEGLGDLARILKDVLLRLRHGLSDPPYNFILHTAPIEPQPREEYHWHIELTPKLTQVAGFEWGTGFYINPTPPELAAKVLREVAI
ncbi:MAG TPA: galactose-1-phosphate uridylyltransferase [Candidatus Omnitrophica bacterium]|nr:MAG: galactose-1-phosphate uridylyltransferase [Omnitrophica WOR_2 bacterium GWA2_63_20]OGX15949.1 MAG: galactose-1-phosphate uridylyltransferase [Omnitrophica WOR_2 bacterium GWF2_63_9]OGX31504.1 MAG: galactose-1-phosphate uridylyltransferase [Omnitrophica WOR_2 bacterium RIFCSPHIGHO2_12_FULL_64_13]OGX36612.1 MAG: galactose-1-phosphate uridylyltransferase [Omnitrophica WOR_2 bacterium RIFCSPHIGHO2_02_FULL_63_39]OGX46357.1 MAG: galactose-1-phosphate uridylyltransferase [Omnitrophica WOR_2 ba